MASVAVIIPAAGSGQRFGGPQNKIFERVGGQPMFLKTIDAFTCRADVVQTILVVSPDEIDDIRDRFGGNLGFLGVQVTAGGACRTESVRNGLSLVRDDVDLVAVHDACRPCISQIWLDDVFAQAERTGAALLAYRVHGTVKRVADDGTVHDTLDRCEFNDLWEAQTPQVFRRELLARAYESGASATDDAALVEAIGHPVSVVPGDPRNIKVTTRRDLGFANAVIDHLPRPREPRGFHPFQND